jgi:pyridine nucleotide-disulfide oxidoreductase family protein
MVAMKRLVLIGAGHAHAQVLKDWITRPVPGTELVVVSPTALAPYSGMVPGWLAGVYRFDEICIDFAALASAAGARFVIDELAAMEPNRRRVQLRSGASFDYDVLSLNVGSTLSPPARAQGGARVLALRPLADLRKAWDALLADPGITETDTPLQATAVGGGAAGVEALLAAVVRLRSLRPSRPVGGTLLTRGSTLLPGMAPAAGRLAQAALAAAGVTTQLGTAYSDSVGSSCNLLLWATGADAHAWQRDCGLAVGPSSFIRVDERLRSVSHPQVHAVGDCAEWAEPLPKAGVYAVRMGPVLSRNLRAALGAGEAVAYRPQHRYLALLATSDGSAIASWGRWSLRGRWVWRWKDRIDRGFLRRFAVARLPHRSASPTPLPGDPA